MLTCAHPLRVHDGSETPSTISLKQASTIAEMRTASFHESGKAVGPGEDEWVSFQSLDLGAGYAIPLGSLVNSLKQQGIPHQ